MKKKELFKNFYSPYTEDDMETMDDWYERYLEDENRKILVNNKYFSKIIYRCEFHIKKDFCLLVAIEPQDKLYKGDVLIDECGNEFTIDGFEMIRFSGNIPEWYSKIVPVSIVGKSYDIGEYLAKK